MTGYERSGCYLHFRSIAATVGQKASHPISPICSFIHSQLYSQVTKLVLHLPVLRDPHPSIFKAASSHQGPQLKKANVKSKLGVGGKEIANDKIAEGTFVDWQVLRADKSTVRTTSYDEQYVLLGLLLGICWELSNNQKKNHTQPNQYKNFWKEAKAVYHFTELQTFI